MNRIFCGHLMVLQLLGFLFGFVGIVSAAPLEVREMIFEKPKSVKATVPWIATRNHIFIVFLLCMALCTAVRGHTRDYTLMELHQGADLVVSGEVFDGIDEKDEEEQWAILKKRKEETGKIHIGEGQDLDDSLELARVGIHIRKVIKGQHPQDEVWLNGSTLMATPMHPPFPASYKKGDWVLVFLRKRNIDDEYSTIQRSNGVKHLKPDEMKAIEKFLLELKRIEAIEDNNLKNIKKASWVFEIAQDETLGKYGLYEFWNYPEIHRNIPLKDAGPKLFTTKRQRFMLQQIQAAAISEEIPCWLPSMIYALNDALGNKPELIGICCDILGEDLVELVKWENRKVYETFFFYTGEFSIENNMEEFARYIKLVESMIKQE